ncbi:uncharacterized protein LOC141853176 [Brevipalpus obovatus]|uniref:uncharacterized protein LOC141853176 n=1 Tax=Brevipalpus obovatus TaxID=246614 RepID=UPI003D9F254C
MTSVEESKVNLNTEDTNDPQSQPSNDGSQMGYGPNRDVIISIQRYGDSIGLDHDNCDGEREGERSRCLPSSNNQHPILSDISSHNPGAGDDSINPPPSYSQIPGTVALYSGRSSGPPPSYDEVVNPYIAPPSYNSLFGQVREVRKSANGFLDFIRKLLVLILGTLGVTIFVGFTIFIPLTMILIGASHMDQCPAENIPIFLIVGGFVWVIKNILNFWSNCRRASNDATEARLQEWYRKRDSWLNSFLFLWLIGGCVLVYRIYPPNLQDPTDATYCNKLVYYYAFWLVTLVFLVFGLFMGCLCCLTLSSMLTTFECRNY